ncbi:MAG: beta-lactamase family protein [Thioploca sp.]|nr:beta-lactamase family protein [Thioploca sp.]
MISTWLFKLRKYVAIVASLGLPLMGISSSSAEETAFINTLPLYSPKIDPNSDPSKANSDNDTILGTITLPLCRFQGDEKTLYSGTLKLNKKTLDSIEYHQVPRTTQTEFDDGFPEDIAQELQDLMENTVKQNQVPGAIILVNYQGKVWRGVAGKSRIDDKSQVFLNKFRVGSVTKMFVASIVLALIQDPKNNLTLDDTMEKWFQNESWYSNMPNGDKITIRDLLRHQSGLYNYTESSEIIASMYETPMRIFTPQELLAVSFIHGSQFEPGTQYSYSNTNYILAGLLIEKITHRSVAENINSRVLEPTGMFNTSFLDDAGIPYYYSHGYTYLGQNILPKDITFSEPSVAWAAGAIVSNSTDLEDFTRLQAMGKISPSEELSKQLQEERFRFANPSNLETYNGCNQKDSENELLYGMGIFCYYGYLGHEGVFPGYNTSTYYRPNEENANKSIGITINLNITDSPKITAGDLFLKIVGILDEKNSLPRKKFLSNGKLPDGRTLIQAMLGLKADEKVIPSF